MKHLSSTLMIAAAASLALASAKAETGGHGDDAAHATLAIPTLGDASAGEKAAAVCAACHGQQGQSTMPDYPKLAGQSAKFLYDQLMAFKSGARQNAIMAGQVTALEEQDFKNLATYFAQQQPTYAEPPADAELALGQQVYENGIADRAIPACIGCHGIDGSGIAASGYPALAGQYSQYVNTRLTAYATETAERANAQIMQTIAARLRPAEIAALSAYVQGLQPRSGNGS